MIRPKSKIRVVSSGDLARTLEDSGLRLSLVRCKKIFDYYFKFLKDSGISSGSSPLSSLRELRKTRAIQI